MKAGDIVTCIRKDGGYCLTEGKQYEVIKYEPAYLEVDDCGGFTWPPYVTIADDNQHEVVAHASRFTA